MAIMINTDKIPCLYSMVLIEQQETADSINVMFHFRQQILNSIQETNRDI